MATRIEIHGYHGTTRDRVESIENEGFKHSRGEDLWLGEGVYFWQNAPERAWERATRLARERLKDPVVFGAKIRFEFGAPRKSTQYVDLLDIVWEDKVVDAYEKLREDHEQLGLPLPPQTPDQHGIDHHIIERLVRDHEAQGIKINAVRATFHQEGGPIYVYEGRGEREESALYTRSQVQIAVRELDLILRTWIEKEERWYL